MQSSEGASTELQAFVLGLGRALVLANAPVNEIQERLALVAARAGVSDARVVVFPTTLMLAFGQAGTATIEIIPQFDGGLRLDQISAVYDLVDRAERAR